jgi:hypothetical protein
MSLVGIGTPPTPLLQASVPPPRTKGWGAHSPAGGELGESHFRRKSLALCLCLLCGPAQIDDIYVTPFLGGLRQFETNNPGIP